MKGKCFVLKQDGDTLILDCEFEGQIKSGKKKTKRQPSAYNKYMSKCLKEKETEGHITERFKRCAHAYQSQK